MAVATIQFDADLSSAVRAFVEVARKVKETDAGVAGLTKTVKAAGAEIEKQAARQKDLAQQEFELWRTQEKLVGKYTEAISNAKKQREALAAAEKKSISDGNQFEHWRKVTRAYEDGAAAGQKLSKTHEFLDFTTARVNKGMQAASQQSGALSNAVGAVGTRFLGLVAGGMLVGKAIQFVTSAFRAQAEEASNAAGKIATLQSAYQAVQRAAGGKLTATKADQGTADALAAREGLGLDPTLQIVAKGRQEKLGDVTAAVQAQASGAIGSGVGLLDTLAKINENLPPSKQVSVSAFTSQLIAGGQKTGASPDELLAGLEKGGVSAARVGASPAELIALQSQLGQQTSRKESVSAAARLSDVLAGDIDTTGRDGRTRKLRLGGQGFAARLSELQRVAPEKYQELMANDREFALAAGAVGTIGNAARDITAAGVSGAPLAAANILSLQDPLTGDARRQAMAQARYDIATRPAGLAQSRSETAQLDRKAAEIESGQGAITRFAQQQVGNTVGLFGGAAAREQFEQNAAGRIRGGEGVLVDSGADRRLSDAVTTGSSNAMLGVLNAIHNTLERINGNTRPGPTLRSIEADAANRAPAVVN